MHAKKATYSYITLSRAHLHVGTLRVAIGTCSYSTPSSFLSPPKPPVLAWLPTISYFGCYKQVSRRRHSSRRSTGPQAGNSEIRDYPRAGESLICMCSTCLPRKEPGIVCMGNHCHSIQIILTLSNYIFCRCSMQGST